MNKQQERDQFIAVLTRELVDLPAQQVVRVARLLIRHAVTHGNLSVQTCNGHPANSSPTMDARDIRRLQDAWDARIARREGQIERRIATLCAEVGIKPNFGGDPRGYTVKVHLPSGRANTLGGSEEGYGVPQ